MDIKEAAKIMGKASTPAKRISSARNGLMGGRPRSSPHKTHDTEIKKDQK
jgi:hypothetical protein